MAYQDDFKAWKAQYISDNGKKPSKTMQRNKLSEFKQGTQSQQVEQSRYIDQPVPQEDQSILGGFKRDIQRSPTLNKAISSIFPSYADKGEIARDDLLSIPGKTYYHGAQGLAEAAGIGDPQGVGGTQGQPGMIQGIVEDPALPVAMATGSMGSKLAMKGLGGLGKYMGYELPTAASGAIPRVMAKGAEAIGEQLPVSALSPANEIGTEAGIAAALGVSLPIVGKIASGAKNIIDSGLGATIGASKELIKHANVNPAIEMLDKGFKSAGDIKANPNKVMSDLRQGIESSEKIAEEFVDKIDNFEGLYITENPQVIEAVKNMGTIDMNPVLESLEGLKQKSALKKGSKIYDDLNDQIDIIKSDILSEGTDWSAEKVLAYRRELDDVIDYAKNLDKPIYSNKLQDVKQKTTGVLRRTLVEQAEKTGNPQYTKAMSDMSKKYGVLENMEAITGKGKSHSKKQRAYNLMDKMSKQNNVFKKGILSEYSKLTGDKDFSKQAKVLDMAKKWEKAKNILGDQTGIRAVISESPSLEAASAMSGGLDYLGSAIGKYAPSVKPLRPGAVKQYGED